MPVEIVNLQDKIEVPDEVRVAVDRAIAKALTRGGLDPTEVEVSVAFVDDARIRELNREFRSKDAPTDVLSFSMGDDRDVPEGEAILGDIVISLETAAGEAGEMGGFAPCVVLLAVHGLLHLLGYDHESDEDAEEMEKLEREIMTALVVPDDAPTKMAPACGKESDTR